MRGQFGAPDAVPLTTGSGEWPIEVYGLATVSTDVGVYAEVVNVVPSKVIVRLRNPAGTLSTLWDGPAIAASEPWIDGDNFIELAQDAGSRAMRAPMARGPSSSRRWRGTSRVVN